MLSKYQLPNGPVGKILHKQGHNHNCVLRYRQNDMGKHVFDCVIDRNLGTEFYYSKKTGRLSTTELMKQNLCVGPNVDTLELDLVPCDVEPFYVFGLKFPVQ